MPGLRREEFSSDECYIHYLEERNDSSKIRFDDNLDRATFIVTVVATIPALLKAKSWLWNSYFFTRHYYRRYPPDRVRWYGLREGWDDARIQAVIAAPARYDALKDGIGGIAIIAILGAAWQRLIKRFKK